MQKRAVLFSAEAYQTSKTLNIVDLPGCAYDISAMQKRLTQIGFDVKVFNNAKKEDYYTAIHNVTSRSPSDTIHIVYFTGHGAHFQGTNYIFPIDSGSIYDTNPSISEAAIDINEIIALFRGKGRLILILDACRNEFSSSTGNFSEMTAAENVYIAYATSFGNTSTGQRNTVSWFTEAICDEILSPDIDIDTLFTRVRQNIVTKHHTQLTASVNSLLENIFLHSMIGYDSFDKAVYDFVETYGDEYNEKHGYFRGEKMVFIDAAQYFNISFLDALWCYQKVSDKKAVDSGIPVPLLSENESKLVSFLCLSQSKSSFFCDEYHTWFYNGRQIRMGEIPPVPPSMQPKMPEHGREINLSISAIKDSDTIIISTNLPDGCRIYIGDNRKNHTIQYIVASGRITINEASDIVHIFAYDSVVFASNENNKMLLGEKCRNLTGRYVKHHPIHGNIINFSFEF